MNNKILYSVLAALFGIYFYNKYVKKSGGTKIGTKEFQEQFNKLGNMTSSEKVAAGIKLLAAEFKKIRKELNADWVRVDVMIAQALLETGNFSSNIFLYQNNLFGMKQAVVRQNTAIGTERGHAVYKNYSDSIKDYIFWFEQWSKTSPSRPYHNRTSLQLYVQAIKNCGYAEDPNYISKIINLVNQYKLSNFN